MSSGGLLDGAQPGGGAAGDAADDDFAFGFAANASADPASGPALPLPADVAGQRRRALTVVMIVAAVLALAGLVVVIGTGLAGDLIRVVMVAEDPPTSVSEVDADATGPSTAPATGGGEAGVGPAGDLEWAQPAPPAVSRLAHAESDTPSEEPVDESSGAVAVVESGTEVVTVDPAPAPPPGPPPAAAQPAPPALPPVQLPPALPPLVPVPLWPLDPAMAPPPGLPDLSGPAAGLLDR